jgi:hydrogenase maturation protease
VSETVFVGIGNHFRRDDGVGPMLAARLADAGRIATIHAGDGAGLIDLFGEHADLTLIDATQCGASPGTVIHLDACAAPLKADLFRYSTHRFGLAEAIETARALGMLPRRLKVIGIEGADFGAGEGLTPEVALAADRVFADL